MNEQETAYRLLRAALEGTAARLAPGPLDTTHWWSLFRLLQQNHVAALCFDAAASTGMPRDVLMPWLAEREKAFEWHRYQQQVQDDIVERMQHHGIETLILKGTHTACHYPQPTLREFGDLDLYFYNQHSEADEVARRELQVTISNDSHHHTKYNYRGVTVESHYDFLNTHYPPSNKRYEALLKEQCPSATFEVLFLLRHMACHFAASRITLRDLVDWTLSCRALEDKVDWHLVQDTVEHYGMGRFVSALSNIVLKHFGIALTGLPAQPQETSRIEHDIVYGSVKDHAADGLKRLGWKVNRWRALAWKRRMVYNDPETTLLLASLTSHAEKPYSILHKQ